MATILLLFVFLPEKLDAKSFFLSYENETNSIIAMDSVNKIRLKWSLLAGGSVYLGSSIVLYQSWYRDFDQSAFHFYDDWNEWRNMDKAGHVFSAYNQASLSYSLAKWIGYGDNKSLLIGTLSASVFQTTIEVMDGFSSGWGFSALDFAANVGGLGLFAIQQSLWKEQKFRLKFSYFPKSYNKVNIGGWEAPLSIQFDENVFGNSFQQRLLKDYNGQTIWISGNLRSLSGWEVLPQWLNFAFGYGVDNVFGGFNNNGAVYCSSSVCFWGTGPVRYSQFYISLDVDLSRIHTKSPFLNTLLEILNIIKMPFSALEINTLGEVKFHLIQF